MKSLTPKELRRVRILQYVLFGVFTLFYCAVLKGDALATLVYRLSDQQWLLSPWWVGSLTALLILSVVGGIVRFKSIIPPQTPLQVRLLLLGASFFLIGVCTNSNEMETLELRTARLCAMGKYKAALKEGERFVHPSPNLLALRVYALSQLQTDRKVPLAECLFDYPIPLPATSKWLLLDATAPTIAPYYARLQQLQAEKSTDLQEEQALHLRLMGALLDGHLNIFVHRLPQDYLSAKPEQVPTIYREALYLYSRLTTNPLIVYSDATTAANYRDFVEYRQKIRNQYPAHREGSSVAERNMMRNMYGSTYWFYYFYERSQNQ